MLIYVAAPYSAPTESERVENVTRAIQAGLQLAAKGHVPIIGNLFHFVDKVAKNCHLQFSWSDFMNWDLEILERCDALFLCGRSTGADIEYGTAVRRGLKIFTHIGNVPEGPLNYPADLWHDSCLDKND